MLPLESYRNIFPLKDEALFPVWQASQQAEVSNLDTSYNPIESVNAIAPVNPIAAQEHLALPPLLLSSIEAIKLLGTNHIGNDRRLLNYFFDYFCYGNIFTVCSKESIIFYVHFLDAFPSSNVTIPLYVLSCLLQCAREAITSESCAFPAFGTPYKNATHYITIPVGSHQEVIDSLFFRLLVNFNTRSKNAVTAVAKSRQVACMQCLIERYRPQHPEKKCFLRWILARAEWKMNCNLVELTKAVVNSSDVYRSLLTNGRVLEDGELELTHVKSGSKYKLSPLTAFTLDEDFISKDVLVQDPMFRQMFIISLGRDCIATPQTIQEYIKTIRSDPSLHQLFSTPLFEAALNYHHAIMFAEREADQSLENNGIPSIYQTQALLFRKKLPVLGKLLDSNESAAEAKSLLAKFPPLLYHPKFQLLSSWLDCYGHSHAPLLAEMDPSFFKDMGLCDLLFTPTHLNRITLEGPVDPLTIWIVTSVLNNYWALQHKRRAIADYPLQLGDFLRQLCLAKHEGKSDAAYAELKNIFARRFKLELHYSASFVYFSATVEQLFKLGKYAHYDFNEMSGIYTKNQDTNVPAPVVPAPVVPDPVSSATEAVAVVKSHTTEKVQVTPKALQAVSRRWHGPIDLLRKMIFQGDMSLHVAMHLQLIAHQGVFAIDLDNLYQSQEGDLAKNTKAIFSLFVPGLKVQEEKTKAVVLESLKRLFADLGFYRSSQPDGKSIQKWMKGKKCQEAELLEIIKECIPHQKQMIGSLSETTTAQVAETLLHLKWEGITSLTQKGKIGRELQQPGTKLPCYLLMRNGKYVHLSVYTLVSNEARILGIERATEAGFLALQEFGGILPSRIVNDCIEDLTMEELQKLKEGMHHKKIILLDLKQIRLEFLNSTAEVASDSVIEEFVNDFFEDFAGSPEGLLPKTPKRNEEFSKVVEGCELEIDTDVRKRLRKC